MNEELKARVINDELKARIVLAVIEKEMGIILNDNYDVSIDTIKSALRQIRLVELKSENEEMKRRLENE